MADDDLSTRDARSAFLDALEATIEPGDTEDAVMPAGPSLHDILPIELIEQILGHFRYRQGELARTCLVCKEWERISKPVSIECTPIIVRS